MAITPVIAGGHRALAAVVETPGHHAAVELGEIAARTTSFRSIIREVVFSEMFGRK